MCTKERETWEWDRELIVAPLVAVFMMSRYLLLLAILLATVCSFVTAAPIRANATRKCNGDASLCKKRYGDVVYIGVRGCAPFLPSPY